MGNNNDAHSKMRTATERVIGLTAIFSEYRGFAPLVPSFAIGQLA